MLNKFILSAALLFFSSFLSAQNKVVVVPLLGDDAVPIENIVTVGLANADFTSPADAINSISDATALEPYLVFIGPGTYTIGRGELVVKPNVYLVGSGIGVTILEAGFGSNDVEQSAVVTLNGFLGNQSALRDLSVIQFGSSVNISSGVYIDGTTSIDNVDIQVLSSGATNYGIYAESSSVLNLSNSHVSVENASGVSVGIFAQSGTHDYRDTEVNVRDGIFVASVLQNSQSLPIK